MKHVVFVAPELQPVAGGGAGVVIAAAVRELCERGLRCTVLCHFPSDGVARAREAFAEVPDARIVGVAEILGGPIRSRGLSHYEADSIGVARALEVLCAREPVDLIEFPDWGGLAFETLRLRLRTTAFGNVAIAIRAHGTLGLIDQAEQVGSVDDAREHMRRMEQAALQLADFVLAPLPAIGELYTSAYRLEPARVLRSMPPMYRILREVAPPERPLVDPGHVLFLGKLQEVKGIDLLVEAAASLLTEEPGRHWRFTIVGPDTRCAAHRQQVSECISALIPSRYRFALEFVPRIDRRELVDLARTALVGVVPSRFETFCIAAHDMRALGLPLVVPKIPAFAGYLDESTGCLSFDGTSSGLREAILRLAEDPLLRERLARAPRPAYERFGGTYEEMLERGRGTGALSSEAAEQCAAVEASGRRRRRPGTRLKHVLGRTLATPWQTRRSRPDLPRP